MLKPLTTSIVVAFVLISPAAAVELARLTPETWDEFAPAGKEVDCIYGDYVLRNDELVMVIAEPLPTRNANMTVRNVGGMLIDLTRREHQNDQLSCYYPNSLPATFDKPATVRVSVDGESVDAASVLIVRGQRIEWRCSTTTSADLKVTLRYVLEDGQPFVTAETTTHNTTQADATFELSDAIRADRTFDFGQEASTGLFWAHDEWFQQAYGVLVPDRTLVRGGSRGSVIAMVKDGTASVTLRADEKLDVSRRIFPAGSLLELRGIANRLTGQPGSPVVVTVNDLASPVAHAKISLAVDGVAYGSGRTDADGKLQFEFPTKPLRLTVEALGRETLEHDLPAFDPNNGHVEINLPPPGYVVGHITDAAGAPIPCKIAFHGIEGTATPDFGPESGDTAVKNLHYSHNGRFRQPIAPGKYETVISFGPEYDAVFQTMEVTRGQETELKATLQRVVDTAGWVSSDFHSHSTPSGDNTSSQLGRVQNLLCEHVEFCPCTEHNRISSYVPHLKSLGVEAFMGTCSGMELTGSPLPVNHQNAFPLLLKARTQDGGAPVTDADPEVQIERLALWDDQSDKLVQENHPNLVQIFGDRDLNGQPDAGFHKMFGFMDVVEVHPPHAIFKKPARNEKGELERNPIFHWMQLLNLGYRIPGVVNTDAHYNEHGSGGLRIYLQSSTDAPDKIDTMEMVHTAEAGHIIMTNGPFLEVKLQATAASEKPTGIPGDDVVAPDGKAVLSVRVQCPNWFDVNRVQVFLNGRAVESLNFTRRDTPEKFSDQITRFQAEIPLELQADTHVIVATTGEGLQIGRVMGTQWGRQPPTAVSNPIFVDVDGGGFKPNGDLLDLELTRKDN